LPDTTCKFENCMYLMWIEKTSRKNKDEIPPKKLKTTIKS